MMTPDEVQSALLEKLAALKDPLDATSDREREELRATRHEYESHVNGWPGLAQRLATPTAKRAYVDDALTRLRTVQTQINDLIAHAVDTRQPEERLRDLAEAKKVLRNGCKYFGARPLLPDVLRELLTPPPCSSCHRPHEPQWPGPMAMLEEELAELDKQIADAQFAVNVHVRSATALLNETVSA